MEWLLCDTTEQYNNNDGVQCTSFELLQRTIIGSLTDICDYERCCVLSVQSNTDTLCKECLSLVGASVSFWAQVSTHFGRDPQQLNIPPPLCFRTGFLRDPPGGCTSTTDVPCCRLAMADLCKASPSPARLRAPIMRLPGADPIGGRLTNRAR